MEDDHVKLVVATVQDQDADGAIQSLTKQGFRITRIGTTGGFLGQGNTTLLIGVEDSAVETVVNTLRKTSQRRLRYMPMATGAAPDGVALYNPIEVEAGGAPAFILTA